MSMRVMIAVVALGLSGTVLAGGDASTLDLHFERMSGSLERLMAGAGAGGSDPLAQELAVELEGTLANAAAYKRAGMERNAFEQLDYTANRIGYWSAERASLELVR